MIKYIPLAFALLATTSIASTKVEVKNNRITVQENGVRTDYGTVRKVESTPSGKTKIYSSKNYKDAAVTIDRFGNTEVKKTNNSPTYVCTYNCSLELEDEDE